MFGNELLEIIGPALAAGLMIALTHAPLGIEVLRRGIIFIDLAVAQIAGLGLVAGSLLIHNPSPWLIQLIALVCAIVAGLFFRKVETAMPERQEAIIGCAFVLAASLALLLLADHPHGGDEVKHLLSGQMLFVTWTDVAKHAPIYALILMAWFSKPEVRTNMGFLPALRSRHHFIGSTGRRLCSFCKPYTPSFGRGTRQTSVSYCVALRGGSGSVRYRLCHSVRYARRTDYHSVICRNGPDYTRG